VWLDVYVMANVMNIWLSYYVIAV